MPKSADAFRTISEVADWLGIQAHVLRFWESKFTQVRPVKRAGGRRYYRPNDMLLLGGIKQLLHEDGLTIKGVQKLLREEGMGHVASMSPPLDELTQSLLEETPATPFVDAPEAPPEEKGVVLSFEQTPVKAEVVEEVAPPAPVSPDPVAEEPVQEAEQSVSSPSTETVAVENPAESPADASDKGAEAAPPADEPQTAASDDAAEPVVAAEAAAGDAPTPKTAPEPTEETPVSASTQSDAAPVEPEVTQQVPPAEPAEAAVPAPDQTEPADTEATASLPAFLRRPMPDQPSPSDNPPVDTANATAPEEIAPVPAEPEAPKPRIIDVPAFIPEHEIAASPAILTAACHSNRLSTAQARQIAPLLAKLKVLRDSMATTRSGATNTGSND